MLSLFPLRDLRVCLFNKDPKILSRDRLRFEKYLAKIGTVQVVEVQSLSDKDAFPCDLLIAYLDHIPTDSFKKWFESFVSKLIAQNGIWVPTLFVSQMDFSDLNHILNVAVDQNLYFDLMDGGQLESLPIRVANLLRIHDHLHELGRYALEVERLDKQYESIYQQLLELKQKI